MKKKLEPTLIITFSLAVIVYGLFTMACADSGTMTHVRSDDDPTIDEPAMSTGLDRRDLERLFDENVDHMLNSRFYSEAASASPRSTIAILPFTNGTTEHVGPQLEALLSKVETLLVNDGVFDVIAAQRRDEILAELNIQQGAEFDASRAADLGRQLGARYLVTGKVYDSAERTDDMRRTQYFLFMQVIDVETGAIRFQHESELSKALVPVD